MRSYEEEKEEVEEEGTRNTLLYQLWNRCRSIGCWVALLVKNLA